MASSPPTEFDGEYGEHDRRRPSSTTNWNVSVTTTPQSPEKMRVERGHAEEEERGDPGSMSSEIWRIVTIARVTHPMMIRLIGRAR